MIRYTSSNQLSIESFKTPFEIKLDKNNRWVKLAMLLTWDQLAHIYHSKMSSDNGAPIIDARIVIGAMIIKHKQKLSDRETIEYIRENPYAQYFLGLSDYTYEEVFDRTLFTTLRERMGAEEFDRLNTLVIEQADTLTNKGKASRGKPFAKSEEQPPVEKDNKNDEFQYSEPQCSPEEPPQPSNKGRLLMDATVADQMIVYPTDLGLLNTAREESERLIDVLHPLAEALRPPTEKKKKPRTYRRIARNRYLGLAKKKKKNKQAIRTATGQQLRYLKRNLGNINTLLVELEKDGLLGWPLNHRSQKIYWVIQHIYAQQLQMYQTGIHSVANRIVNVYQPYVRPIVRGKEKASVEFGAKLGVSLQEGFARINTLSWEAYNENSDLKKQVLHFYQLNGHYPEAVLGDNIYGTRDNRAFLKQHNIRFAGKPLGRRPKEELSYYQKRKQQKERNLRNHIEGKFGEGKNAYNLSKIRARKQKTSESWISCIFFVMNIQHLFRITEKTTTDFLFFHFNCISNTLFELFELIVSQKTEEKINLRLIPIV